MKIIFLDFDGVISTYRRGWKLDIEKLVLLQKIINETNAKVVVSSSWKKGYKDVDNFKDSLYKNWRCKEIQNSNEQILYNFVNSIYDITGNHGSCRGEEIKQWLIDNKELNVESYVIIDDDSDMLDEQLFNFVQTDCFYGLSERTVSLSIDILNNKKIINPIRLNIELMNRYINQLKYNENNNIEELL